MDGQRLRVLAIFFLVLLRFAFYARFQLRSNLTYEIQGRLQCVLIYVLSFEAKKALENLEDDPLRKQILPVELTNEVDVTEKALFVL